MADNSVVSADNWPKFELIQAFRHALDTCKNEEDPVKMKSLEWPQDFSHYKSMGIFQDTQVQLIPDFKVVLVTSKNEDEQNKIKAKEWPQDFLIKPLWDLSVAMGTRVLILPSLKPNNYSDKM